MRKCHHNDEFSSFVWSANSDCKLHHHVRLGKDYYRCYEKWKQHLQFITMNIVQFEKTDKSGTGRFTWNVIVKYVFSVPQLRIVDIFRVNYLQERTTTLATSTQWPVTAVSNNDIMSSWETARRHFNWFVLFSIVNKM